MIVGRCTKPTRFRPVPSSTSAHANRVTTLSPPSSTKRAAHPGAAAIEMMVRATRLDYPDGSKTNGLLVVDVVPFEEEGQSPFVGCSRSRLRDLPSPLCAGREGIGSCSRITGGLIAAFPLRAWGVVLAKGR